MSSKPKVVFFGNERLASGFETDTPVLRALISEGYEVCAVVTNYEQPRSRKSRPLEIQAAADELGIPVLMPNRLLDITDQLRSYSAKIAVLVAYGKIVPQAIIDIFPHGIVNIHPSLLPLHRGSIPIESVILDGSAETGVSLMQLVKAMDAGPVYTQIPVSLNGTETKAGLTQLLLQTGKDALITSLPGILDGSLQPQPQIESQATYDSLLTVADGVLDFTKPAARLEREVRAYAGWPKSRTRLAGKDTVINRARAMLYDEAQPGTAAIQVAGTAFATNSKEIAIQTAEGVLIIERLTPAGRNDMSAAAFLAGNKL